MEWYLRDFSERDFEDFLGAAYEFAGVNPNTRKVQAKKPVTDIPTKPPREVQPEFPRWDPPGPGSCHMSAYAVDSRNHLLAYLPMCLLTYSLAYLFAYTLIRLLADAFNGSSVL